MVGESGVGDCLYTAIWIFGHCQQRIAQDSVPVALLAKYAKLNNRLPRKDPMSKNYSFWTANVTCSIGSHWGKVAWVSWMDAKLIFPPYSYRRYPEPTT